VTLKLDPPWRKLCGGNNQPGLRVHRWRCPSVVRLVCDVRPVKKIVQHREEFYLNVGDASTVFQFRGQANVLPYSRVTSRACGFGLGPGRGPDSLTLPAFAAWARHLPMIKEYKPSQRNSALRSLFYNGAYAAKIFFL
jgi:hypothetical protein